MDVSLLALFASAVVYMFIGSLWYSPAFLGKTWMKLIGISEDEMRNAGTAYAGATAMALVMSYVLVKMIAYTGATHLIAGMRLGFWLWLGFVATSHFSAVIWQKKPFKLFLIDAGCMLVALVLMGGAAGLLS